MRLRERKWNIVRKRIEKIEIRYSYIARFTCFIGSFIGSIFGVVQEAFSYNTNTKKGILSDGLGLLRPYLVMALLCKNLLNYSLCPGCTLL